MNLKLLANTPVDLYSLSPSIPVGSMISVQNMGGDPIFLSTTLAGLNMDGTGDCRKCDPGQVASNASGDVGAFVVCYSRNAYINVRKES